jgi:hypothetical protein
VVPPHDEAAVADALNDMLDRAKTDWTPAFEPLTSEFAWDSVVQPLRHYCLTGRYAPDRQDRTPFSEQQRGLFAQALYLWSTEGLGPMLSRAWKFLRLKAAGF